MDDQDLCDLVQFLSAETNTDITAVENVKEETELGTQYTISLFVHARDVGDSKLYRSKVGPSAAIQTEVSEVLEDGTKVYDQVLCSSLDHGYATIHLYCQNTRIMIVEDCDADADVYVDDYDEGASSEEEEEVYPFSD
jgi:hypothetical protein